MSFDTLGDLNWLAVVVAGLAYFLLGALWYAPFVFGKMWMRAAGIEMPESGQGPGAAIYVSPFVGAIVASIATAMLAVATASTTFGEGIALGIVIAVGYALVLIGITATFETGKPDKVTWFLVSSGYHMVGLLVAAVIVSVWT